LALDPIDSDALSFLLQVERFYAILIESRRAGLGAAEGSGLGGKLVYVGEIDAGGRALMVAGNISGAASLAATADPSVQKQAVRDGVADFLVTSLSEALRIVKNQIRKHEPVAVCVATAPEALVAEMLERGVAPDLLRPADEFSQHSPIDSHEAWQISSSELDRNSTLLTWRVAAAPALWLPKLDAIALECMGQENWAARRWLRLSPRYLGRLARGIRLLVCTREIADGFIEHARGKVESGEIGVAVEIQVSGRCMSEQFQFSPRSIL
jgi:hypothetical protein